MKAWRTLSCFGIFLALWSFSISRSSAAQPSPVTLPTYHIEVNTQANALYESNPPHLSERSFAVSQDQHQYPFRIAQPSNGNTATSPSLSTHLLVVFPPGVRRPKNGEIIRNLARVLAKGWLVSVARSDGAFTPYSTGAALTAALAAASTTPLPAAQANLALLQATQELKKLPGRRVLLVDLARSATKPSHQWLAPLTESLMPIYLVDGGQRQQAFYDTSWGYSRGPSPSGVDFAYKRVRYLDDGVFHEINLAKAVKDALRDARFDYDLSFQIPDSQFNEADPITLTLKDASGIVLDTSRAELYTVSEQTVQGETLSTRSAVPQKVIVQYRP
ncbi:MAG: hypothetical protein WB608_19915 [Terracidiphilus sp.]